MNKKQRKERVWMRRWICQGNRRCKQDIRRLDAALGRRREFVYISGVRCVRYTYTPVDSAPVAPE